ncbi:MAG: GH3 auxin-responsive promoter [Pseudopedobacter saltans]|uniref:GH3 auxin-responsive promoter n=1 Tax=Pseudopedobacter saltans TaxID=151895 RepID=A0A2W5H7V1_9SPHI|nr:MAG: GH3 auxin-responsive promoter [Pseudopedobacter saltans]
MALFDINLPKSLVKALKLPDAASVRQQKKALTRLLRKARFTEFGQEYNFDKILLDKTNLIASFQENVPITSYNGIYKDWWHKTIEGKSDICWPGKIKFFALSSGTSEAASKYLPITKDLLKANKIIMIKQLLSLRSYQLVNYKSIGKGWLTLGGSTDLQKGMGYYAGDLSGITTKKSPFWFQPFYKPGKKIAKEKDWNKKIEEIVKKAPEWDIGFLVGVPSWAQLCMEKIIERYQLNSIHDIWPNFEFFVHGGVSFEPYKKGFEKLLGKPVTYIETYLASEGFLAYQNRQLATGMRLATSGSIFFEFLPFNDQNFDENGELIGQPKALSFLEAEENVDYALIISTPAGAWRYLIGDTIRIIDKMDVQIIITGRIKHFLSLVGEHLSQDNMNQAITMTAKDMDISIAEYTVIGEPHGSFFAHHWYIGSSDDIDKEKFTTLLDLHLKALNDDYAVERKSTLKEVIVDVLPDNLFIEFLEKRGKVGSQIKFPRVLKGNIKSEWQDFLSAKSE